MFHIITDRERERGRENEGEPACSFYLDLLGFTFIWGARNEQELTKSQVLDF